MRSNFDFVVDRCIKGRIYPAFAQHQAEPYTQSWREFDQHWPYTVPLRLQEYCDSHGCSIVLHNLESDTRAWFYPIALGWFDFDIDYFALLASPTAAAVRNNKIKILFYYHEGDNPQRIKQRLDFLIAQHQLPQNCYKFVLNNSAADQVDNFVFFPDSELWFWQRNRHVAPLPFASSQRRYKFTALVRQSKDFRMAVMADLWANNILEHSQWSYCETGLFDKTQCPIAVDEVQSMTSAIEQFQQHIPHWSDTMSQQQRNDHSTVVPDYFTNSYFHLVLETHFDADQSGGTLLSEKTFKPIKHAQPFFIVGPSGSLKCLRQLGYKTFDHVLDNSYDDIVDNTQRWLAVRSAIVKVAQSDTHALAQACRADCEHNQQLFSALKHNRVSKLAQQIYEQS